MIFITVYDIVYSSDLYISIDNLMKYFFLVAVSWDIDLYLSDTEIK